VSDMEAPTDDAIEQEQTLGEAANTEELDVEAPEADAVEQHTPVGRSQFVVEHQLSAEVDEGDAAEQAHVIESDDDDYR
jgi:hypothetical protein